VDEMAEDGVGFKDLKIGERVVDEHGDFALGVDGGKGAVRFLDFNLPREGKSVGGMKERREGKREGGREEGRE